jgi:predicted nucleic acid-binding protein
LLAAWTDAPTFVWLLTEEILSEYVEVLERLRVRSARRIVALIREQGQLVRILKKIPDLPDRDDAPFCVCAESADADFIVTLNPSDFRQSRVLPRKLLKELGS